MVGIVVVSHSRKLAEGVKELAEGMSNGQVPIAAAGGMEDGSPGTDAYQVVEAIRSIYRPEGVLVLADLGSAVLSARLAQEMLAAEGIDAVRLSPAPLVEGALAAVVEAAQGSTLEQVDAAVREAKYLAKLGEEQIEIEEEAPSALQMVAVETRFVLRNRLGLHARPAVLFAQTAARYQASIEARNLTRNSPWVNPRSVIDLLRIGASVGDLIAVQASGAEAAQALEALKQLAESGFGEE
ncbi:MAG: dihydroxyacetone kinase phosphoryl donor subunit DhaM [Chloroflexi bacterium]|nr:dihydroxyacetone kinase phosphoryl donor subunit DhaM [Chloroflexota bacterium]